MTIYFISGLGADSSAFAQLELPGITIKHIQWVKHHPEDTMISYASKLLEQIDPEDKEPVIAGLSFGGMLAVEISRLVHVKKTILISSALSPDALPPHFKVIARLGLNKYLPDRAHLWCPPLIANFIFGATSAAQKEMLHRAITEPEPAFIKWAANAILTWNSKGYPDNLYSIHGTADRVLPYKARSDLYTIAGGGHLMVLSHAAEISAIIQEIINSR